MTYLAFFLRYGEGGRQDDSEIAEKLLWCWSNVGWGGARLCDAACFAHDEWLTSSYFAIIAGCKHLVLVEMVKPATVREALQQERRRLAITSALTQLVGVALSGTFFVLHFGQLSLCVLIWVFAAYGGFMAYRYWCALRCPRCSQSLGPATRRDLWWSFPNRLRRCPFCDLDLDRDLDSIQTI